MCRDMSVAGESGRGICSKLVDPTKRIFAQLIHQATIGVYGHCVSPYRNPIDSHGTSATTMSASSTAPRYGHTRPMASSGDTRPIAHAA
jgi:hypothetical protein